MICCGVIGSRTSTLAQADHHHLQNATANRPGKICVRLNTVHDDDPIGPKGFRAKLDPYSIGSRTEVLNLHRRIYRYTETLFSNVVRRQNFALSVRRSTSMTAHRRNQEGSRVPTADHLHNAMQNGVKIGDGPAANGNRDPLARFYSTQDTRRFELF